MVQEAYNHTNSKLREYLRSKLIYDFDSLRSNQPLIRAVSFVSTSEKIANSNKLDFKLVGYSDYNNFNENEYYEEEHLDYKDVISRFDNGDTQFSIKEAFKENPSEDVISFQFPEIIFGIQNQIIRFRNSLTD